MSEWISVKDRLPPCDGNRDLPYVLAYHTIYEVGVAWFWQLDGSLVEDMEEDTGDKYLCSGHFIKNILDGNYCIDDDDDIDIFENSPHFRNLGTITHWMPLPKPPKPE